ncbi:MAG: GNAT family N-acetyltransferase [Gammaproteobacteria bacterium]|nr:GNAT family N-acetyltransferase [Gammaproteobacteria bacterium]HXK56613.1 GNAT family N-acetyltransferase [Gammaproteobacteria bacterium]
MRNFDLLTSLSALRCPPPLHLPAEWRELLRPLPFRYPLEDEQYIETSAGRRVLLRPIRPGDSAAYEAMFHLVARDDVRFRFFSYLKQLPSNELLRFQKIDYDLNINYIALGITASHEREMLGVVGATVVPEESSAEFGLLIRSDQKGRGLGRMLMEKLIGACMDRGIATLRAEVMTRNLPMLALVRKMDFQFFYQADGSYVEIRLRLRREKRDDSGGFR